jgi:hypothetical protein
MNTGLHAALGNRNVTAPEPAAAGAHTAIHPCLHEIALPHCSGPAAWRTGILTPLASRKSRRKGNQSGKQAERRGAGNSTKGKRRVSSCSLGVVAPPVGPYAGLASQVPHLELDVFVCHLQAQIYTLKCCWLQTILGCCMDRDSSF